jgi:hypothetical protein
MVISRRKQLMMMKKQQAIVLGLVTLGFGTVLLLPRLSGHLLHSAGGGARIVRK